MMILDQSTIIIIAMMMILDQSTNIINIEDIFSIKDVNRTYNFSD